MRDGPTKINPPHTNPGGRPPGVGLAFSRFRYRYAGDNCGLNNDQDPNLRVHVTQHTPATAATATCDCVIRLMAASERRELHIEGRPSELPPVSGAALSLFFQESRSCLRKVSLTFMALSDDLCLALATMPRLDVELEICYCSVSDDAAGSFVECLQSDRGPVRLRDCEFGIRFLRVLWQVKVV
jgi:hypothetical protein